MSVAKSCFGLSADMINLWQGLRKFSLGHWVTSTRRGSGVHVVGGVITT